MHRIGAPGAVRGQARGAMRLARGAGPGCTAREARLEKWVQHKKRLLRWERKGRVDETPKRRKKIHDAHLPRSAVCVLDHARNSRVLDGARNAPHDRVAPGRRYILFERTQRNVLVLCVVLYEAEARQRARWGPEVVANRGCRPRDRRWAPPDRLSNVLAQRLKGFEQILTVPGNAAAEPKRAAPQRGAPSGRNPRSRKHR